MARFEIKSKDGLSVRFSGKPSYNGSYLKPSYIEFDEIASPTPIAWEVGDYLDYSRTGMRYYLYSLPQPSKNARRGANGGSFTYSNVQLYSATKDLEIALFRDLVDNDNNIHFSTSPDVVTFENVEGIARRIQACMDDLYPNKWDIRIADFDAIADVEVIEKIAEAKDFALSGGTCLDALSKIYELWEDIGWFHSYDSATGKEVITIGYSNRRNAENTTESYLYGKGNGLTAIRRNQTNRDEFATRLYVYGSERNLPARYYNEKDILNAESVNIRNLMLPIEEWGKTNGKPDARLAYLENASAVAKFGIIPKVHYFDSEDAGADIYPSIQKMTIGKIRKALADLGQTQYSPSESIYPNASERVDVIRTSVNPSDNGVVVGGGKEWKIGLVEPITGKLITANVPSEGLSYPLVIREKFFEKTIPANFSRGKVRFDPSVEWSVVDSSFESVDFTMTICDTEDVDYANVVKRITVKGTKNGNLWTAKPYAVEVNYDFPYDGFSIYGFVDIEAKATKEGADIVQVTLADGEAFIGINEILDKTFHITLKQIGFDINLQADLGEGKCISMKTGMCAGRNFIVDTCFYNKDNDTWVLDLKRQKDKTLGMMFPNANYKVNPGDEFVLLDIAMPEVYVRVSEDDLLSEGQKLLARASKVQTHYEPSIDAKVMIESGRSLREGMFMEITDEDVVDNTTDYILIDTLSIYENESAIPTYDVTLRERRKVTYKGTPSATSSNDTESVGDDIAQDVEVDLSDYYTKSQVDNKIASIDVSDQLKNYATKVYVSDMVGELRTDHNALAKKVTANEGAITSLQDSKADKATTIAGYGIEDAYTKEEVSTAVGAVAALVGDLEERFDPVKEWHSSIDGLIEEEDGDIAVRTNLIIEGDVASSGLGELADSKNKGYFKTLESLQENYPIATAGCIAYVGANYPYAIYTWDRINAEWVDSGEVGGEEIPLGNYYTKEETHQAIKNEYIVLTQAEYDALTTKEDKLYFCYEE